MPSPERDGTPPVIETDAAKPQPPAEQAYAPFSQESLYALLVGELAGQRNRFDIALKQYSEQARLTRDPGVAERAYRIAEYLGAQDEASTNALIWADAAPSNLAAQRAAAIQLARSGRYEESMTFMEKVLQAQGNAHFDFLALSAAETDPDTRAGILNSFDRLLRKHPENGQLLFGKALLLHQDDKPQEALALLEQSDVSQHDIAPLLLRVRLLQSLDRSQEALPLLRKAIKEKPQDRRLRLTYARLLIELDQLEQARREFSGLLQESPEDDDLRFSLALVCLESQAWDEAIVYLEDLIERDAHLDPARYNLGRAFEETEQPERALEQYQKVGPGNEFLPAQLRQSEILLSQGQTLEARKRLAQARQDQPDYAIQLYLIEVEGLSQVAPEQAWISINQGLAAFPDDTSLLYTRGMLADGRNDLAQVEQDMRRVLALEPDNANALNALGYTLTERTDRYPEALKLIEQAYRLDPQNPAILDSLGWVHYRLGNLQEAEALLRQAYENYPDPEVAAHLGEVLWHNNQQQAAREVWRQAQKQDSDDRTLNETILRLTGSKRP